MDGRLVEVANPSTGPPRVQPHTNMLAKALNILYRRYNQEQLRYMGQVYNALLCTNLACALGMWMQWRKLCQLNLSFAMFMTSVSIILTYYHVLMGSPAWNYLLLMGFVSGFVLEVYARLAFQAVGMLTWRLLISGTFCFELLILSALFAPLEPHPSRTTTRWLWRIHLSLFAVSILNGYIRSRGLKFLLVASHLASAYLTVPYDTKSLLRHMMHGNLNVVLSALILFMNLFGLMRDILLLTAMKNTYSQEKRVDVPGNALLPNTVLVS